MIRVLLVDDNTRYRQTLCRILQSQADIEIVEVAGSLAEARGKLGGVDVAIVDRGLPDGDGLELIGELRQANPDARVLILSATIEAIHPGEALEAGASVVLDKMAPPERVFAAIRSVGGE
jgi:DNA-binding NarL/FixJ family response regulator